MSTRARGPAFAAPRRRRRTDGTGYFSFAGVAEWRLPRSSSTAAMTGCSRPRRAGRDRRRGLSGRRSALVGRSRARRRDRRDRPGRRGALPDSRGITVYATVDARFFPVFDWSTLDLDYSGVPGRSTDRTHAARTASSFRSTTSTSCRRSTSATSTASRTGITTTSEPAARACDRFDPITGSGHRRAGRYARSPGIDFDLLTIARLDRHLGARRRPRRRPARGRARSTWIAKTGPATWELDIDTALTDVDGYADVFGLGDGDYRLRYSVGGVFKADRQLVPRSSFAGVAAFRFADSRSTLDGLLDGPACGCGFVLRVRPRVWSSRWPATRRRRRARPQRRASRTRPFSSFTLRDADATPTPTPTPTSSPSPSSSPSARRVRRRRSRPRPGSDAAARRLHLGGWWLLILLALGDHHHRSS